MKSILTACLVGASFATPISNGPSSPPRGEWNLKLINGTSGPVTAGFRGLSLVSDQVVWVSGTSNTVYRTTNGGLDWQDLTVHHNETFTNDTGTYKVVLDFRDIQAFSHKTAIVMAAGPGTENQSGIWRTDDGGKHWRKSNIPPNPVFYDCMAWENESHGILLQDSADANGSLGLLETNDSGRSWHDIADATGLSSYGQAAFAASGTCISYTAGRWYIVAGGTEYPSRVFRSSNGHAWKDTNTTLVGTPDYDPGYAGYGYNSIAFRDDCNGLAVGGSFNISAPASKDNAAYSHDGGANWIASKSTLPYRSGVSWIPGKTKFAVAVGAGTNLTRDGGRTWESLRDQTQSTFYAVQCLKGGVCWASGRRGAVGRIHIL